MSEIWKPEIHEFKFAMFEISKREEENIWKLTCIPLRFRALLMLRYGNRRQRVQLITFRFFMQPCMLECVNTGRCEAHPRDYE